MKINKFVLARRFFQINNTRFLDIRPITIEFKSSYAIIEEENRGLILLNRNGQKKLYKILKERFEGK